MITIDGSTFHLSTDCSSYAFRVLPTGQLEHLHFGARLQEQDLSALHSRITSAMGTTVVYNRDNPDFSLDRVPLEYSGIGKGDFRHSPLEIRMPDGTWVSDFVSVEHSIADGVRPIPGLPSATAGQADAQSLVVTLRDRVLDVELQLTYTVFAETGVFSRRASLINHDPRPLVIRRFMSMMVDLPDSDLELVTLDGAWIRETHRHRRALGPGLWVNESTTGSSSNRHNPGILLCRKDTGEERGECMAFNLVYSGNHYTAVEMDSHDSIRVMSGISPHCFEWQLGEGERFDTPEAVMCHSTDGFNGVAAKMHRFVNQHIVRGEHRTADRPVLFNTWEAHFFDFNRRKILRFARAARRLGAELVVLDDGWFGARNSDQAGLGDYRVNTRKLPGGLRSLAAAITRMDLRFGLWFEPEMVNEDSDLFRTHPDWTVRVPGRDPSLGRNQLVLDLCRPEVRDYIVANVSAVLRSAEISYVKWDMNRHMSDMYSPACPRQGEFFHRYLLGLYEVLHRILSAHPHVLFESCASGGNRFDLGMLCHMPQVWASDNTDPIDRLRIQEGLSCLYPPSVIGAHVSAAPHHQTLRTTPLSTRFNVAAFGLLGYELDPADLSPVERRQIREQIAFYRAHRRTLQYGRFERIDQPRHNQIDWQCRSLDGKTTIRARFQTRVEPSPAPERLRVPGLDPHRSYRVTRVLQPLSLATFGSLARHAVHSLPLLRRLPWKPALRPDGPLLRILRRRFTLPSAIEEYRARGDVLMSGIRILQQFMGTGYRSEVRFVGDFGSTLYMVTATDTPDIDPVEQSQDR